MVCRQIGPDKSVLEADYQIECPDEFLSSGPRMLAGILTSFLIVVPTRALWRALALPRRTRCCKPLTHRQGLLPWAAHLRDAFATPALLPMAEPEPEPTPEPEPEPEGARTPPAAAGQDASGQDTAGQDASSQEAAVSSREAAEQLETQRSTSRGGESRDAVILRLKAERAEQFEMLLEQQRREQQDFRCGAVRKVEAVEALIARFNQTDVLKLRRAEPTQRFNPPRAFWRVCSHKTKIDDLNNVLDVADWVRIHRVVRRALQPWAQLVLLELRSAGGRFPESVVSILTDHFSGSELVLLVMNEKRHSLPSRVKEINQAQRTLGRFPISKQVRALVDCAGHVAEPAQPSHWQHDGGRLRTGRSSTASSPPSGRTSPTRRYRAATSRCNSCSVFDSLTAR